MTNPLGTFIKNILIGKSPASEITPKDAPADEGVKLLEDIYFKISYRFIGSLVEEDIVAIEKIQMEDMDGSKTEKLLKSKIANYDKIIQEELSALSSKPA